MVDGGLCTGDDEEIDQASSTKERSILIYKKYAECQIQEQNLYKVKSRSLHHQTLVLLKSWQISVIPLPLSPPPCNKFTLSSCCKQTEVHPGCAAAFVFKRSASGCQRVDRILMGLCN